MSKQWSRSRLSVVFTFGSLILCACESEGHQAMIESPSDSRSAVAPSDSFDDLCQASNTGVDSQTTCQATSSTADDDEVENPLSGAVYSSSAIELFWAGHENESETLTFDIYRDGSFVGSTRGASHFDDGLVAQTTYTYAVHPVALDGSHLNPWQLSLITLSNSEAVGASIDTETPSDNSASSDTNSSGSETNEDWITVEPEQPSEQIPTEDTQAEADTGSEQTSASSSSTDTDGNDAGDSSSSSAASSTSSEGTAATGSIERSLSANVTDGQLTLQWSAHINGDPVELFDVVGDANVLLSRTSETQYSMTVNSATQTVSVYAVTDLHRVFIGRAVVINGQLLANTDVARTMPYGRLEVRRQPTRQTGSARQ